jgi:hypothetical protein
MKINVKDGLNTIKNNVKQGKEIYDTYENDVRGIYNHASNIINTNTDTNTDTNTNTDNGTNTSTGGKKKQGKKKQSKKKGGTKSDEIKKKAKQTIIGNKYEHRKPINEAIDKLKKTAGNEMVGPPHFLNEQPWIDKYKQVNKTMLEFGEKKNDLSLVPGGFTDMRMKQIKIDHLKKLKKNKKEHKQLIKQVQKLPKPPKSVKKTKKGGKKRSDENMDYLIMSSMNAGKRKYKKNKSNNDIKELILSRKFKLLPDSLEQKINNELNGGNKKIIKMKPKQNIDKTKKINVKKTKK